jgi:hypothetical protein
MRFLGENRELKEQVKYIEVHISNYEFHKWLGGNVQMGSRKAEIQFLACWAGRRLMGRMLIGRCHLILCNKQI